MVMTPSSALPVVARGPLPKSEISVLAFLQDPGLFVTSLNYRPGCDGNSQRLLRSSQTARADLTMLSRLQPRFPSPAL